MPCISPPLISDIWKSGEVGEGPIALLPQIGLYLGEAGGGYV